MSKTILEEAQELVDGARRKDYGEMDKSFERIRGFWASYLGNKFEDLLLTRTDVAMMMILMKVAREMEGHKRDSLVDIAGYAYCASKLNGDDDD